MKIRHSNRRNLPLATQKRGRRGLLKLLASLSPVAVAAALLMVGFALASSGVEEAHAAGPITITADAFGSASPTPGSCLPPNSYHNGDFTINQGGNPLGLCGDGVDENTSWTLHFTPNLCDPAGPLTHAVLTLTLTPRDPGGQFTNDTVGITTLPSIPVDAGGWTASAGPYPLVLNSISTIHRDLITSGDYTGAQILGVLNDPAHPDSILMGYQDDATINRAELALTCEPVPCAVLGGLDISTGKKVAFIQNNNSDLTWTVNSGQAHLAFPRDLEYPGGWVDTAPLGGSHWIHASSLTAESNQESLQTYVYEAKFTVPNGVGLTLNFQWAADNNVTFELFNSSTTLVATIPPLPSDFPANLMPSNWNMLHPPSAPATYTTFITQGGQYTLRATVGNPDAPTPSGLLLVGTVSCGNSVGGIATLTVSSSGSPFPSLPLAAVAASVMAMLGAGVWYGRRRWLR